MISLEAPGAMRVPADFIARAAPLVGTPFRIKGEDLKGWDCRGCARWVYREILGVAVESYQDAYSAEDVVTVAGGRRRAQAIAERLASWRPVRRQAGAIVQLTWLGRAGHVAVMLDGRRFLHADVATGTTIGDLTDRTLTYSPLGFFVPAFVTEVIHD